MGANVTPHPIFMIYQNVMPSISYSPNGRSFLVSSEKSANEHDLEA